MQPVALVCPVPNFIPAAALSFQLSEETTHEHLR